MKDKCHKCKHKTAAGEPVMPHRLGDLVCPEVQAGRVLAHPRWIKFKDQYPKVKLYSGGQRGKGPGKTRSNQRISGPNFRPGGDKGKTINIKDTKNPIQRGPDGKFKILMTDGDQNDSEWI